MAQDSRVTSAAKIGRALVRVVLVAFILAGVVVAIMFGLTTA